MFRRFVIWLKRWLFHTDGVGINEELHIEQWRNGKKIYDRTYKAHSAVNAGLALVADRVGAVAAGAAVTYLALGTDSTAVAATQTTLGAEITDTGLARASATVTRVTTTVTNDTLQLYHDWTATGVKILREIGAFNDASAGSMLARKVYDAITTANTDHVIMTYKFPFTAV
jgi:type IV secretory pathway TrbL component